MTERRVYWTCFGISLIGASLLIIMPSMYMDDLPDRIPIHYGSDGMPDGYGRKTGLWSLSIVGCVIFAIVSAIGYIAPSAPRDPKMSEERHRMLMDVNSNLLGILNIVCTWVFVYISYRTILVAMGHAVGLGQGMLPIFLAAAFIPIGYSCWKMYHTVK